MQDEQPPSALGVALRERREELGLSIYEVAKRAGIDRGGLHRIEAGVYLQPEPERLARLAKVLDLPVTDLYQLAGYPVGRQLPSLQPYLRAKYRNLPPEAVDEIHRYFEDVQRQYGASDGPNNGEDEQET